MAKSRKIAAVCDVHLESQGCQQAAFARFLDELPGMADEVVIIGDLLDSLETARLSGGIMAILGKIRRLPIGVTIVPGNHDPSRDFLSWATGRLVTVGSTIVTSGSSRIYIEHGSRFDWAADFGWITRAGDAVGEWLHKIEQHAAGEADKIICKYLTGCYHNVHHGMVQTMRNNGCNACIAGHTHRPEHHADGYYNAGSFAIRRPTYALIEDGNVSIREFPLTLKLERPKHGTNSF